MTITKTMILIMSYCMSHTIQGLLGELPAYLLVEVTQGRLY
jgi:hypothetical protein